MTYQGGHISRRVHILSSFKVHMADLLNNSGTHVEDAHDDIFLND